jgi:hypothetical protein
MRRKKDERTKVKRYEQMKDKKKKRGKRGKPVSPSVTPLNYNIMKSQTFLY